MIEGRALLYELLYAIGLELAGTGATCAVGSAGNIYFLLDGCVLILRRELRH